MALFYACDWEISLWLRLGRTLCVPVYFFLWQCRDDATSNYVFNAGIYSLIGKFTIISLYFHHSRTFYLVNYAFRSSKSKLQ